MARFNPPEMFRWTSLLASLPRCPHGCDEEDVYPSPTFPVPTLERPISVVYDEVEVGYRNRAAEMLERHRGEVHGDVPDLTREELQAMVDDLGTDLYRAQDLIAFVREMCDAADADGSEVTTERVRGWLAYTGCGGVLVLPEGAKLWDESSHECGFPPVRPRKASPAVQQQARKVFGAGPEGYRDYLRAKHPVTLEELDADPDPLAVPNAEDCPQCVDPNPAYPWICPGHPTVAGPATAGEEQR